MDYKAILENYSKPVPRYTSYPTAPHFKPEIGTKVFEEGLESLDPREEVSVYLHIPYCDRLCWFCGCHTKHTLKYAPISRYVRTLAKEMELLNERLGFRPLLKHLHLGGGSPSLLKSDELIRLRDALDLTFRFGADTEVSIEIDPCDVNESTISTLREFGVTRASLGVQDFSPEVQEAINRPQSYEETRDVVWELREAGVNSINIDALYGLPLQHESRLIKTIEQCISLQPDRMALFGYAHVPWLKKHQRLIKTEDLPDSFERYEHSQSATQCLISAGYEAIGIDHFAKPDDDLAHAKRAGTLKRNFQGYTTDTHQTMLSFGASSIGRFPDAYVQNIVATPQYEAEIFAGRLTKAKGLKLSMEDQLRSHVIERLMCDFRFDFADLADQSPSLADRCLEDALFFAAADRFDLCQIEGTVLKINEAARPFTRIIASQFDAYYLEEQFQYSKAV